ncbi:hypothetical protein P152DRAFT_454013 [Eremomyces bilateralis CBS 781.70]|uniref:Mediator of RNA polymerase II transcription subunit 8 n=1 Tax=Eremomyces bilateralis CBS 781.70 TaxID=1392243 RepID=A0A6G1GHS7_9PEZI|nr:uncharacterized protein P152DRAFT_454013 [Eremomyces bilateralis CBS 781.70]KAF1817429.1 hypothetical protein P152DRAFT_454013 [Eremomyces bilateralis CBS 781.70]
MNDAEKIRQRLVQIGTSLNDLIRSIENAETLPPWPAILRTVQLLTNPLTSLRPALQAQVLNSMHVYPASKFPGRTEEMMLQQLLRKKLDPKVEDWITSMSKETDGAPLGEGDSTQGFNDSMLEELWDWAGPAANEVAKEVLMPDEEDEEEEDEEMADADETRAGEAQQQQTTVPGMSLEQVLRFTVMGQQ